MSIAPTAPPAGWYANPEGSGQRYWDGARWTEHMNDQPPPPAMPAATAETNGLALAALLTGLSGVLIAGAMNILFFAGWALGAVAVVLGILGRRKSVRRTMATWGVALGVVAFAFGVYGSSQISQAVDDLDAAGQEFEAYSQCLAGADTAAEIDSC